jgi:LacI family transcriptional regulator
MTLDLEDIARLAGVSRSTVSRVLNNRPDVKESTRQRVLKIIEQHNYHPNNLARALVTQRTRILSLVIPQPIVDVFTEPYNPIVIQGVTVEASQSDYAVMLWMGSSTEEEQRFCDRILSNDQFDGLIMISSLADDPIVKRLAQAHFPFLLLGPPPVEGINFINTDNFGGAREAVLHLIDLDWQRIGMITGPETLLAARDRLAGYYDAMQAAGRLVDPALVVEGGYGEAAGYQAMLTLIDRGADAVFVSSDVMALGALRAAQDSGRRVPDDLGIVGFDDIPSAATSSPALTTVHQPIQDLGGVATRTLINILDGSLEEPHQEILPTELIVRETCGASRKGSQH